jgi:hypothetical protein
MFKIDKGIPIPDKSQTSERKYPWSTMAVGDSFFVPAGDKPAHKVQQRLAGASKPKGKKFTSRVQVEEGVTGVRVWRVPDEVAETNDD